MSASKVGFAAIRWTFTPKTTTTDAPAPAVTTAAVYIAQDDNPHYLGAASVSEMARHIFYAKGPSGSNRDYLLRLAESLRDMEVTDVHVTELEHYVRRLEAQRKDGSSD